MAKNSTRSRNDPPFAVYDLRGTPEQPTHRYVFYVTGYGKFPLGLLLGFRCWPTKPTDAAKIEREDKTRSICLTSNYEPTGYPLWAAVGWPMGSEKLVT